MAQLKQENSKGPNVDSPSMLLVIEHFGRHVLKSTTKRLPFLLVDVPLLISDQIGLAGPAKVTDLDSVTVTNEQVFRLQVPVDEAVFVEEVNSCGRLDKEPKRIGLGQSLALRNPLEQSCLGNELHNQVEIVWVDEVGKQAHNVRVFQLLVDLNLPLEGDCQLRLFELRLR